MGLSEGLSDDGTLTGRGPGEVRGAITGLATTLGGTFHALPFIIPDLNTAVVVASAVVACELVVIAYLRKRFLAVSWRSSLLQVTLGGVLVTAVGFLIGNA
jgi:erythrin-vacuolar iron transport family protein